MLNKIKSLLKKGGVLFVTTNKSNESKEGFYKKTNYVGGLKRFRKFWTKKELYNILSKRFKIVDYFEEKNIFKHISYLNEFMEPQLVNYFNKNGNKILIE